MAKINVTTSKPTDPKSPRTDYVRRAPSCRRCGEKSCTCSDDELDAGGPAL